MYFKRPKNKSVVQFERFELENGLRVLVHEDRSTPMVAVNVLYDVGSRDEHPERTGFAHLFEHLMFGGSVNIPDFDDRLQKAGGEDNAFTNTDYTNFYEALPADNIETALWLESDRMLRLQFSEEVLDVQRKVVLEEFKETCLNEPFGDMWHLLSPLAFQQHPYRWPVIGQTPAHIEQASLSDVESFFYKYYRPNNAILTLSGRLDPKKIRHQVEKWFGDIPPGTIPNRSLPAEPPQEAYRRLVHQAEVPVDALYMAFRMPGRADRAFYPVDLLSDVLCNGESSRLYRRLLREKRLFTQIDCYVVGQFDPGLLMIEGKVAEGVRVEEAEAAVWDELQALQRDRIPERELQKWKNKAESNLVFSELSALSKGMNLAYFEVLGDANLMNTEASLYNAIHTDEIFEAANYMLRPENCASLHYCKP
ncbi:MAG: M16 family metallopeptidase [Haliscomenobacter sp.]